MAERERTSLESLALFLSLGERLKIDGKVSPHGAYVKNAKIGDMDVSVAYWPADESGGALLQTQSFKASTSRLGVHVEETRKTTLEYIGSDIIPTSVVKVSIFHDISDGLNYGIPSTVIPIPEDSEQLAVRSLLDWTQTLVDLKVEEAA